MIVSVDGGCDGVKDVAAGKIAATAQPFRPVVSSFTSFNRRQVGTAEVKSGSNSGQK